MRKALPTAALACLLSGAGCDYWRNLTEEKAVDRARSLDLQVRDVWTREPVKASCRDDGRGIDTTTGDSGSISLIDLPTGAYAFDCADRDSDYYRCRAKLHLGPEATDVDTVFMARKGDKHWFTDDARKLDISIPALSGRVPEVIRLNAQPADDKGRMFRYEWSDSCVRFPGEDPAFCNVGLTLADTGEKTFRVKVFATPPGFSEYEIGTDSVTQTFEADHPPFLRVEWDTSKAVRANCLDPQFNLGLISKDSVDGYCDSTFITSLDTAAALGALRMATGCFEGGTSLALPILKPTSRVHSGRFRVEARDDNGLITDTVITYRTNQVEAPFIQPISLKRQFLGFQTRFPVVASGASPVTFIYVDFGDGSDSVRVDVNQDPVDKPINENIFTYHAAHLYAEAKHYTLSTWAENECGLLSTKRTTPIDVVKNTAPTANIKFLGFSGDTAEVLIVSASDPDLNSKADSLTLFVNWDDVPSSRFIKTYPAGETIEGVSVTHVYTRHGNDSASIVVNVSDTHGGEDHAIFKEPLPP